MTLIERLHPRRLWAVLDTIDRTSPSHTLSRPAALRRIAWVLASACLALWIHHYGRYDFYVSHVAQALWGGEVRSQVDSHPFRILMGYGWWLSCHLVAYILIPWLIIRYVLRERFRDFGWRWGDTHRHWRGYVLLMLPVIAFAVIASFGDAFTTHYPFYKFAPRSWVDLLAFEAIYLTQFVIIEFFFRGYLLTALRPAMGAASIFVMCIPYLMIHFPKLAPEAGGAILFGLFLGILALQSRSIWGGVMVHMGVALSMDMAALYQKGGFPSQWWP